MAVEQWTAHGRLDHVDGVDQPHAALESAKPHVQVWGRDRLCWPGWVSLTGLTGALGGLEGAVGWQGGNAVYSKAVRSRQACWHGGMAPAQLPGRQACLHWREAGTTHSAEFVRILGGWKVGRLGVTSGTDFSVATFDKSILQTCNSQPLSMASRARHWSFVA